MNTLEFEQRSEQCIDVDDESVFMKNATALGELFSPFTGAILAGREM